MQVVTPGMPVVEKIVVEHSASQKAFTVHTQVKASGQQKAFSRNSETVVKGSDVTVLDISFHILDRGAIGQLIKDTTKDFFVRTGEMLSHISFTCLLLIIGIFFHRDHYIGIPMPAKESIESLDNAGFSAEPEIADAPYLLALDRV